MDLQEAYQFLNFWINKSTGSWYSPEELDLLTDRGQMSLFSDLAPKYGTSQEVKDALAPFKQTYTFGTFVTSGGNLLIPEILNFQHLLDISVQYTDGAATRYSPVEVVNEDERTNRLRSQINPVTATEPIAEQKGMGNWQLWPKQGMDGFVTYLVRPVKPFFSYITVSGRVIVYDAGTSVQLQWREMDQNKVLIKALESIGINIGEADIQQWAQTKAQENFIGQNRT